MFNTNGLKATLIQNNRGTSKYYDDQDKKELDIKVCPYNSDQIVRFGIDTTSEAKGYFIVKADTNVREGDELIFNGKKYSVIEVHDNWIWNKIANLILVVK